MLNLVMKCIVVDWGYDWVALLQQPPQSLPRWALFGPAEATLGLSWFGDVLIIHRGVAIIDGIISFM